MDLGKNIFLFLWAILFIVPTIKAQHGRDSVYLHRCEVINPVIYEILDSLESISQNCIFYALNKPYGYHIEVYEKSISFEVEQLQYIHISNIKEATFFYHRNHLVIVNNTKNDTLLFHAFEDSLYMLSFCFRDNLNLLGMRGYIDYVWINYQYDRINNHLIFDRSRSCDSISYYVYKVQAEDTWMNLCDKINCNTYYWITTLYPKQPWFYNLMKLVCAINLIKMEAKNDIDKNDLWNTSTSTKIDMKKAETPDNSILFPKEKDSIYLKFFYKKGNPLRVKRIG